MARASRPTAPVTRLQLRLAEVEKRVAELRRQFDVQRVRLGQLQAKLDGVRSAWVKMTPPPARDPTPDSRSWRATKTHAPP